MMPRLVKMVMGAWASVDSDTPSMFCRMLTSLLRDISSPVLVAREKTQGKIEQMLKKPGAQIGEQVRMATQDMR